MDAFEAISMPDSAALSVRKRFKLAEANRALPLVQRIVTDIVREYARLRELHRLCREYDTQGDATRAEQTREQYMIVTDKLTGLRDELEEIGCELKDYALGLVDFPARIDGRDMLLCWKLGESRVEHWHGLDAGFGGRQPVDPNWE